MTDQQGADAMSCVDTRDLTTPAMDSLAAKGVLFRNAYCTQPICGPSRASMFTGLMPRHACLTSDKWTPYTLNMVNINEKLRDRELGCVFDRAGYECAYAGKWHIPEISIPEGHGFRKIGGFGDTHLADRCIDFIRQRHDKPFFLVASFDNPHNICEWARNMNLPWGPVPDVSTEECPGLPANFAIPPFEPECIRVEAFRLQNPELHPTMNYTDEKWRHYRHAYHRLTEKVDAEIGRILDALKEQGLDRDTLIVFLSDHGDGQGAHHWNQKEVLYEESVRVPFIICWDEVTAEAGTCDHLVSTGLDLLPTLCDYAGIAPPDNLPGRSLRVLADGGTPDDRRQEVVAVTTFDRPLDRWMGMTEGRMLRTEDYKYVVYTWGAYREQLFAINEDPGEMVNLAVSLQFKAILQRHRDRLRQWCTQTNDDFARNIPQR